MKRLIIACMILAAILTATTSQAQWKMRVHENGDVTEFTVSSIDSITFYNPPTDTDLVFVQADTFLMGSPEDEIGRDDDETQHTVILTTDFYISSTEITNQQYADMAQWAYDNGYCMATSSTLQDNLDGSTEELLDLDGSDCEISFSGGTFTVDSGKEDHPVMEVSWYGAVSYCDWRSIKVGKARAYNHSNWECNGNDPYGAEGYRLPTEAEWEFACRAGTETAFANGVITNFACNDPVLDLIGWYCGNADDWTHPAAELITNDWDLYDMHGNNWEWCNDWYGNYGPAEETDPVGSNSGPYRVLRGGAWHSDAQDCRSANRGQLLPSTTDAYNNGFRICRSFTSP